MARNYKRDSKGRFAKIRSIPRRRRAAKIRNIKAKHKRVDGYFKNGEFDNLKGTALHDSLIRRQGRRQAKIKKLMAKQARR